MTDEIKAKSGRRSKEYLALQAEIETNKIALSGLIARQVTLEAEISAKKDVMALLEKIIGKL